MQDIIFGIDLGTSTSAVAYSDAHGTHMISAIGGAAGSPLTPSMVFMSPDGRIFVGGAAIEARLNLAGASDNLLFEFFKRHIGAPDLPYQFRQPVDGLCWEPVALSALILRKLKEDVAATGRELRRAVITHPQTFYITQKNATVEAARIAGIDVVETMSEPHAACLAMGLGESDLNGKVMVFDIGGGTLDVNILEVAPNHREVLGTSGDHYLGGKDFDDVVSNIFERTAKNGLGYGYADGSPTECFDWRNQARRVKEELQQRIEAKANLSIADGDVFVKVKRGTFNDECAPLFGKIAQTTNAALQAANCDWRDLQQVIMVGGSSRLLVVQNWLRQQAGDKVKVRDNPDLTVAEGASLRGHRLLLMGADSSGSDVESGICPEGLVETKDVNRLPRELGVMVHCQASGGETPNTIAGAGQTLPAAITKRYVTTEDDARRILIKIVEFEASYSDRAVAVGSCTISDLPRVPKGTPVEVTFNLRLGGGLDVTATCVGHQAHANLTLGAPPRNGGVADVHDAVRARARDVPIQIRWVA